jgi:hypothetical protein
MPDFTTTVASTTSTIALKMAGRRLADVDTAHVYDAFAISLMMLLEDIGFCAKGERGVGRGGEHRSWWKYCTEHQRRRTRVHSSRNVGDVFAHGSGNPAARRCRCASEKGSDDILGARHGTARHGTGRDGADGGGPQHGRSFDRIGVALSVPAPHRHGVRRHAMDGAATITRQLSGAPQHCSSNPKLIQ